MFDLFANFDFKTYNHDPRHTIVHQLLRKEDQDSEVYEVMVLPAAKLKDLCDLYPKTDVSLKYKALDRRNYFLKAMQEQEIDYGVDRDPMTGLKRRDNKYHTLKEEIVFEDEIKDYTKVKLLHVETGARSGGEGKKEQDIIKAAKRALKEVARMKSYLTSMQLDFDDGSLKRIAPSKNIVDKSEFKEDLTGHDDHMDDDAIYIELEKPESDSSCESDGEDDYLKGSINRTDKSDF